MSTPIVDFVQKYIESGAARMHMPGHKGEALLGAEAMDITEVSGADSLYEAEGIILESERRTAALFGTEMTLYSTEGSSQCIRAMLALARLHGKKMKTNGYILAARNAHKTFVTAAGLLDLEVRFIEPREGATLLSSPIDPDALSAVFQKDVPLALYITSPDYLGNTAPIERLSALCHRYGTLLLVDNAHGAYQRFLSPSRHPIDLGADMCCDSAHKTLPALTGAAYLHLSKGLAPHLYAEARDCMALFGSTSPSYLILQSLDLLTQILSEEYPRRLAVILKKVGAFKEALSRHGFSLTGDEALKVTLAPKDFGYEGTALAALLREGGVECEFADADSLVLMLSPYTREEDILLAERLLTALPRRAPIEKRPPSAHIPRRACSIREAMLAPSESVFAKDALGRTLGSLAVSCPPAVPPVICGEVVDEEAIAVLDYYGITKCRVLTE